MAAIGAYALSKYSAQSTPGSPTAIETHPGERLRLVASRGGGGGGGKRGGRDVKLIAVYRSRAQIASYLSEALDLEEERSGFY